MSPGEIVPPDAVLMVTNPPPCVARRLALMRTEGVVDAQPDAERRFDDGSIDQYRIGQHKRDQFVVAPFRVVESKVVKWSAFLPQQRTRRDPHARDQFDEARARRWRLQIFDDDRLLPLLRISASTLREVPQPGL